MLNFILGSSGSGKTHYIKEQLEKLAMKNKENLYLIVPEQSSYSMERSMLEDLGEKAARKIEIISFFNTFCVILSIEEIVEESGTSRGSFYHYFEGKDALLSSLSYLFDDKYAELEKEMDKSLPVIEKLKYMNQELFLMIENTVSVELLSRLFATQLTTSGERHMLSTNRTYYKLLRQITIEGKEQDVFKDELSINDVTRAYAMFERGLMYEWCISGGNYSLCQHSQIIMPLFLEGLCK